MGYSVTHNSELIHLTSQGFVTSPLAISPFSSDSLTQHTANSEHPLFELLPDVVYPVSFVWNALFPLFFAKPSVNSQTSTDFYTTADFFDFLVQTQVLRPPWCGHCTRKRFQKLQDFLSAKKSFYKKRQGKPKTAK